MPLPAGRHADPFSMVGNPLPTSLRRGATITEVSQVLRHRDLATTVIYAKVDFAALHTVAQPWPGAAR